MMQAFIYGRLGGDPRQHQIKSGKTMVSVSIAVDVTGNSETQETLWLKVLTFNRVADQLLERSKGDLVSLSGRVQQNRRTKDGEERVDLQLIADSVISARTVRPGGRKKQEPTNKPGEQPNNFDDDVPF